MTNTPPLLDASGSHAFDRNELRPVDIFPATTSYLDVEYARIPGFRPLGLDLHIPHGEAPRPVVVYAHAGGFAGGDRSMGQWAFLLRNGYAVASVSYRLREEAVHPAGLADVRAAIRWVRDRAAELTLDGERIVGFGSSAGGFHIGMSAALGDRPEAVLTEDVETSTRVQAAVMFYSATDFLSLPADAPVDTVEVQGTATSTDTRYLGFIASSDPTRARSASIPDNLTDPAPAFFIAHGDADRRVGVGQAHRLTDALRARGVPVELHVVAGADHGDPAFASAQMQRKVLDFLAMALSE